MSLGKIVYLSEAQLHTLFANGSVTSNGTTVTYSADDIYVTPVAEDGQRTANISGITPSIQGIAGVRYICGECSTLSITAPASGCIDVMFESGSTATVLTVTSAKSGVTAVKWPDWFDPTNLSANAVYELNILDGEFGMVSKWT